MTVTEWPIFKPFENQVIAFVSLISIFIIVSIFCICIVFCIFCICVCILCISSY